MEDNKQLPKLNDERCRCCFGEVSYFSEARILDFQALYLKCKNCSSVQVANPEWIDMAHSDAISDLDTGLVSRCISASRLVSTMLFLEGKHSASGIDWGGGTGLLTRLLRDQGFTVKSYDKYTEGKHTVGFNINLQEAHKSTHFITAVECFEHLIDPVDSFKSVVQNKDYFIFTTNIIDTPPPNPSDYSWWYFMPDSGQHITFASKQGIEAFMKLIGFDNYYQIGNLHVMSKKPLKRSTKMVMSHRLLRGIILVLIPEYLNRKYSLVVSDSEKMTPK